MCDPTRRQPVACARGPLPASRSPRVASTMPNPMLILLAQLRADTPRPEAGGDDRGGRPRRHADHGPIVAGLMLSGFLTEACLMGRIAGGPYEAGGAVAGFALLFLAWFWLSLGCLLQA